MASTSATANPAKKTIDDYLAPPSSADATAAKAWSRTPSGKRIQELNAVETDIKKLLQLAGYTLASIHPEPMDKFTTRECELTLDPDEDEEDEAGMDQEAKKQETEEEKQVALYAKEYYSILNDVQYALRASISHLSLSRASVTPTVSLKPLNDPKTGNPAGWERQIELLKALQPIGADGAGHEEHRTEEKETKMKEEEEL